MNESGKVISCHSESRIGTLPKCLLELVFVFQCQNEETPPLPDERCRGSDMRQGIGKPFSTRW